MASEIKNYNITALGLSETSWTQSGQVKLSTGEMVLHSNHKKINDPYTEAVAFMLSQEGQQALIGTKMRRPNAPP